MTFYGNTGQAWGYDAPAVEQSMNAAHPTFLMTEDDLPLQYFFLSPDERRCQRDLIAAFDEMCNERGLRYCITAGSLLGAYRHGKSIPWDDDLDVVMPSCHEDAFLRAVEECPLLDTVAETWGHKVFLAGRRHPDLDVFILDDDGLDLIHPGEAIASLGLAADDAEAAGDSDAEATDKPGEAGDEMDDEDDLTAGNGGGGGDGKVAVVMAAGDLDLVRYRSIGDEAIGWGQWLDRYRYRRGELVSGALVRVPFFDLEVWAPPNADPFLRRVYGEDCFDEAVVGVWDHEARTAIRQRALRYVWPSPRLSDDEIRAMVAMLEAHGKADRAAWWSTKVGAAGGE